MTPPMEHDYMGAKDTELRLGLPGSDGRLVDECATVGLTLGGTKRVFSDVIHGDSFSEVGDGAGGATKTPPPPLPPAAKTQIVGWPPIHSYRKNTIASNTSKNNDEDDADRKQGNECHYVKVSMDGAPYLRKVNLNMYSNYKELSLALEEMFTSFTIGQCGSNGMSARETITELLQGSEHVLTYEDKDGDWMLVGDVPWLMFADSCRRLRIMKGSDTVGIGKTPKAIGSKIRN
ncbi:auxin-responsive protein IAA21-like isoform X1 [Zingiber officinale]|uniref:auxin-responsive protein IAA21-like isoform X1 n=1 Tax=Zingiber officinale TaxID=94328 RepID=UPI001C4D865B|nr:auxin-responsive protein IAA21-like isoform X1 [Zingiber officinale]